MLTFILDGSSIEATFSRLADALTGTGFEAAFRDVGTLLSGDVQSNFDQRGRGSHKWSDLSPRTTYMRRARVARGEELKGAEDQPLLAFGGIIHAAAVATSSSVKGSLYALTPHSVTLGIDPDAIEYAKTAMGLTGKNPERNPMVLEDMDIPPIVNRLQRAVDAMVDEAQKGGI